MDSLQKLLCNNSHLKNHKISIREDEDCLEVIGELNSYYKKQIAISIVKKFLKNKVLTLKDFLTVKSD
jgi:hypothetical protein